MSCSVEELSRRTYLKVEYMFAASSCTRAGCSLQKLFGHVVQLTQKKSFDTKNVFEIVKLVKLLSLLDPKTQDYRQLDKF